MRATPTALRHLQRDFCLARGYMIHPLVQCQMNGVFIYCCWLHC